MFGFCLLTRGMTGYGIGCIKEMIFKNNHGYHVLLVGGISVALRVLYAVPVLWLSGSAAETAAPYLWESLRYCVSNMILTVPVELLLWKQFKWQQEEEPSYGK